MELNHNTDTTGLVADAKSKTSRKLLCPLFVFFGLLCTGLGIVGAVVPGMPTTVFLIIALWCFSKSSERFRHWLLNHRRFGPTLRAWHEHRCIPRKGKVCAVGTMSCSMVLALVFYAGSYTVPLIMALVMTPVGLWIVTRPSVPQGCES